MARSLQIGGGKSEQNLIEAQGKNAYGEKLNSLHWKQKYFRHLNVFVRTWKDIPT